MQSPKGWSYVSPDVFEAVWKGYSLPLHGYHGLAHWERVREIGRELAARTGANVRVLEYFAALHDSRRINEDEDPEHGPRAAAFARSIRSLLALSDAEFRELEEAITLHSDGVREGTLTVQCCYDSDRLDLARVGILPRAQYLCTSAAQDPEMIRWAVSLLNED